MRSIMTESAELVNGPAERREAVERDAETAISKAVVWALMREPFFGLLLCETPRQPAWNAPTMGVSATTMFYNPVFVLKCTPAELRAVLIHEVLHLASMHFLRQNKREARLWNMATDYAINAIIVRAGGGPGAGSRGGFRLPEWGLYNEAYADKTAEEIYDILKDEANTGGSGSQSGDNGDGGMASNADGQRQLDTHHTSKAGGQDESGEEGAGGSGMSPVEAARVAEEIANRVFRAAEAARRHGQGRGYIPGSIEEEVRRILQPTIPWNDRLRGMVLDTAKKNEYRYEVRSVLTGSVAASMGVSSTWVPGLGDERIGVLAVAVDTSASVSPNMLSKFWAEIEEAKSLAQQTIIMMVDAGLQKVYRLGPHDPLPAVAVGRGGTSFDVPFEYLRQQQIVPDLFIYFTDGECPYPRTAPPYPVTWVLVHTKASIKPARAPWGETIYAAI